MDRPSPLHRGGLQRRRWLTLALGGGALALGGPAARAAPTVARVPAADAARPLPPGGRPMPSLDGATGWLQSAPLTSASLRGNVVLVDFWTFACGNCRNALPHVRGWHEKYKDRGLVVVGVHSPELPIERDPERVLRAARELGLAFPIALDNNFAIWRAFSNRYWPAHYFVDAQGRIRFEHFGEGEYDRSEQVIRQLLDEARPGGHQGA